MESFLAIATVAAVSCVGILSPGPDFIAVSYASITGSRRDASAVAAGVVVGNGIWAGAALLGVGTLFALFPSVFITIKTLGALYLMWLGVQLLRSARSPLPVGVSGVMSGSLAAKFSKGLSTTMSNPKAAIYYASALSSAAPTSASLTLLGGMLLTVVVIAAIWFSTVVYILSTPQAADAFRRFKVYFESFFGVLLLSFGVRQMANRFLGPCPTATKATTSSQRWDEQGIGNLRVALNALVRLFRLCPLTQQPGNLPFYRGTALATDERGEEQWWGGTEERCGYRKQGDARVVLSGGVLPIARFRYPSVN